jgi:hypothetical protein
MPKLMPTCPSLPPHSQQRIQSMAAVLRSRLKDCSKTELEMLIRYYVRGEDEASIIRDIGCPRERFVRLKQRLRQPAVSADHKCSVVFAG